jgi:aerotolerance regulator-like protein
MQFLYPGFLWALFALSVPIILHLFYFRRYKKVYFSNVRFLREVKEETSARNKLRNLLILIMRCLAIAFLVFAFAQPFIPVSDDARQGAKNVSVFVDNSFSMQSFGEDLPLLDRSKQRASEIISAYTEEDKFQILTHELRADQQRYLSQAEALLEIEDIYITPAVSPLSDVVNRQIRLSRSDTEVPLVSYVISDFQRSITDLTPVDSSIQLNLIPVQSVQEKNVTIDSAWFEVPVQMLNQTSQLIIRVTNYSSDKIENIKLTSSVDGQEKPVSTLELPAGESVYDTAHITILSTGWHKVTLRITDFPVQFDDTYYLTFYVDEEINILAINGLQNNPRLDAAFESNPHFNLENQNIAQLNYSTLKNYDLIILNEVIQITSGMAEEIYGFVESGGRVLFFPAPGQPGESYSTFLSRSGANTFAKYDTTQRTVGSINTDEFLFRDVYINTSRNLRLPVTEANYLTNKIQSRAAERILTYRDGSAFIEKYNIGRGSLFVCTAPLSDEINDLSKNAEIFIPLLYKAAVAIGRKTPNAYVIGGHELVEIQTQETEAERVYTFKGAVEFIPGITPLGSKTLLDPVGQIKDAGYYDLLSGEDLVGVYAFNYDRTESPLSYLSTEELSDAFGDFADVWVETAKASLSTRIAEKEHGIILWRWCIILALTFLGLEILLIRFWKT